jgi:hypothetical protein
MKRLLIVALVLAGCGGGEDLGDAPDVRGLALPEAKQKLERANYRPSVKAEDALFGVIIEGNFTSATSTHRTGGWFPSTWRSTGASDARPRACPAAGTARRASGTGDGLP